MIYIIQLRSQALTMRVKCNNVAFKSILKVTLTVITYSVITVKPSVNNKVLTDFELPL